MKIGLNCQYILIDNPAGPERFTLNLYRYLARNDNKNTYVLYFNSQPSEQLLKELTNDNSNFSYKVLKSPILWTQFRLAFELLINPVDVFFTPIHTLPFVRNYKTKFVAMIHGLEYKTNNKLGGFSFKKVIHPTLLKAVIKSADKIAVPSQATKNAIINQKMTNEIEKITIINEGVGEEFYSRSQEQIEKVLNKYDLGFKKYLLFVSTIQPRKNIVNLIHAFSIAHNEYKNIDLVLVGKLGWKYDEILTAPKKFGVEKNVRFLNWVSQADLPYLFSGSLGYVNMSYDEGFGLTVLEAMASEIPVVVSDIPAHKEVGADLIKYVNANDVKDIANGISTLLKGEVQSFAKERAKKFTWDETAKKFIELYVSLKPR